MTFEELEAGEPFGRYRDVDGDGIPYRTLPGVHPPRGAYFTRGTSRDPDARYSEEGPVYVANMERLLAKFETAPRRWSPRRSNGPRRRRTPHGVIYFGSTSAAMNESLLTLEASGRHVDALRVRGFPFSDAVLDFIAAHETSVRRRAEPRRPASHPDHDRGRRRPGEADPGAQLRRLADHRALHHRRDHPAHVRRVANDRV